MDSSDFDGDQTVANILLSIGNPKGNFQNLSNKLPVSSSASPTDVTGILTPDVTRILTPDLTFQQYFPRSSEAQSVIHSSIGLVLMKDFINFVSIGQIGQNWNVQSLNERDFIPISTALFHIATSDLLLYQQIEKFWCLYLSLFSQTQISTFSIQTFSQALSNTFHFLCRQLLLFASSPMPSIFQGNEQQQQQRSIPSSSFSPTINNKRNYNIIKTDKIINKPKKQFDMLQDVTASTCGQRISTSISPSLSFSSSTPTPSIPLPSFPSTLNTLAPLPTRLKSEEEEEREEEREGEGERERDESELELVDVRGESYQLKRQQSELREEEVMREEGGDEGGEGEGEVETRPRRLSRLSPPYLIQPASSFPPSLQRPYSTSLSLLQPASYSSSTTSPQSLSPSSCSSISSYTAFSSSLSPSLDSPVPSRCFSSLSLSSGSLTSPEPPSSPPSPVPGSVYSLPKDWSSLSSLSSLASLSSLRLPLPSQPQPSPLSIQPSTIHPPPLIGMEGEDKGGDRESNRGRERRSAGTTSIPEERRRRSNVTTTSGAGGSGGGDGGFEGGGRGGGGGGGSGGGGGTGGVGGGEPLKDIVRRKRTRKNENGEILPKGIYPTNAGAYRVQMNTLRGSTQKLSKNVQTLPEAYWLYEIALLALDTPSTLSQLLEVKGNFTVMLANQLVDNEFQYLVGLNRELNNERLTFRLSQDHLSKALKAFHNLLVDDAAYLPPSYTLPQYFYISNKSTTTSSASSLPSNVSSSQGSRNPLRCGHLISSLHPSLSLTSSILVPTPPLPSPPSEPSFCPSPAPVSASLPVPPALQLAILCQQQQIEHQRLEQQQKQQQQFILIQQYQLQQQQQSGPNHSSSFSFVPSFLALNSTEPSSPYSSSCLKPTSSSFALPPPASSSPSSTDSSHHSSPSLSSTHSSPSLSSTPFLSLPSPIPFIHSTSLPSSPTFLSSSYSSFSTSSSSLPTFPSLSSSHPPSFSL